MWCLPGFVIHAEEQKPEGCGCGETPAGWAPAGLETTKSMASKVSSSPRGFQHYIAPAQNVARPRANAPPRENRRKIGNGIDKNNNVGISIGIDVHMFVFHTHYIFMRSKNRQTW